MRRFLYTVLIFTLLTAAGIVFIFCIPVNKKYTYTFVNKAGCHNRSAWIYRMIYEDTTNIDVAFIGSSHTMCAINDTLLEKQYNALNKTKLHFLNMGFCGLGRNFEYLITRDLLERKSVNTIVLEVPTEEWQFGHPNFANLARSSDVVCAPIFLNRCYIQDIYTALLLRLQYLRELVTGEDAKRTFNVHPERVGFNGGVKTADYAQLHARHRPKDVVIPFVERGMNAYSLKYIEMIVQTAKEHDAKVIFLYIPEYQHKIPTAEIVKRYEPYGTTIIPPMEIFVDTTNWQDEGHLTAKGGNLVSEYLVGELMKTKVTR